MVTSVKCSLRKRLTASASSQDTNPSLLLRARSVSQRKQTRFVKTLRVILNGLGKDAAQIISRINGFTYVETKMNYYTGEVEEVFRKCYSTDPESPRAKVNCYGANDVTEGVAIMWKEA